MTVLGLLRALLILAPFAFWLVAPGLAFPFVAAKARAVETLAALSGALWLVLLRRGERRISRPRHPVSFAVLVWILALGVSTVLGVDPARSFRDTAERELGLLSWLHHALIFVVLAAVFDHPRSRRALLAALLVSSGVVFALGVWQRVEPGLLESGYDGRPGSTTGSPVYLGGLAALFVFLAPLIAVRERGRRWWIASAIVVALAFAALLASESRGALVALALGGIAAGTAAALFTGRGSRLRWVLGGLTAMTIATLLALLAIRGHPLLERVPGLRRLAELTRAGGTHETRLRAWRIAADSFREHPILGRGPCNFYHAFNQHYDPAFLEVGFGETWWDNAHNVVLDVAATGGSVGVLAWLAIALAPVLAIVRAYTRGQVSRGFASLAIGSIVAIVGHGLFAFLDLSLLLAATILLSFLTHETRRESDRDRSRPRGTMTRGDRGVMAVLLGGVVVLTLTHQGAILRASRAAYLAVESAREGRVEDTLASLATLRTLPAPRRAHALVLVSEAFLARAGDLQRRGLADAASSIAEALHASLEEDLDSLDPRPALTRARLANALSATADARSRFERAAVELERARGLSPRRQETLYLLAAVLLRLGEHDRAIAVYRESVEISPEVGEGWTRLALALAILGEHESAREVIATARTRGVSFSAADLERIARVEERGRGPGH